MESTFAGAGRKALAPANLFSAVFDFLQGCDIVNQNAREQEAATVGGATVKPFFDKKFSSSLDAMGQVLHEALQALVDRDWIEQGSMFYARLCLEEALVNAVTHGNACDPSRAVRLTMTEENDACLICVYDEGPGFAPETLPAPEDSGMGGRGVVLIQHCMEEVRYNSAARRLEMKMRRKPFCMGENDHE